MSDEQHEQARYRRTDEATPGWGTDEGWDLRRELFRARATEPPALDWRKAIADADEWIGWDTIFCYWCGNTEAEGHANECVWVAARLAREASR
jgi:hypothetical protein